MLINVISAVEDSAGIVDASYLEHLIKTGTITAFKRSSGWVRIGQDPVREDAGTYAGPDRRKIDQRS
jgi:hypothetical protein